MTNRISCENLVLGPRPGKKSFKTLEALKLTHCVTLLSEREDPHAIEKICKKLNCRWLWLPIEGGQIEHLQAVDLSGYLDTLHQSLAGDETPKAYLHCSAGIHRTGFFAYVILRTSGVTGEGALEQLARLRPVTSEQVGSDRIELAESMVQTMCAG